MDTKRLSLADGAADGGSDSGNSMGAGRVLAGGLISSAIESCCVDDDETEEEEEDEEAVGRRCDEACRFENAKLEPMSNDSGLL